MTPAEPLSGVAPRPVGRTVVHQAWLHLTFLHWAVEPARIAPLLPAGVRPDEHGGAAWIGLVPFLMQGVGPLTLPGIPYLGTFCETNVRTYSVDARGRRGVVFLSLDAARLAPVLAGRAAGLPYVWSRMRLERSGGVVRYACRRRWPGPGPTSRVAVRPGPVAPGGALEHFLTSRWGLHERGRGSAYFWPNEHDAWPLRTAELLQLDDGLLGAAGFGELAGTPPASVLYSPGVRARFGPRLPAAGDGPG